MNDSQKNNPLNIWVFMFVVFPCGKRRWLWLSTLKITMSARYIYTLVRKRWTAIIKNDHTCKNSLQSRNNWLTHVEVNSLDFSLQLAEKCLQNFFNLKFHSLRAINTTKGRLCLVKSMNWVTAINLPTFAWNTFTGYNWLLSFFAHSVPISMARKLTWRSKFF